MEYSARNRHCLVDMEYNLDNSCLEDSLLQPADPVQADTAAAAASTVEVAAVAEEVAAAAANTAATQGDASDRPKASGALPALVQVGVEPRPKLHQCLSHCPSPHEDLCLGS